MPKYLLQLTLALSLVLNAMIAPWAMAGLLGGHHGMTHSAAEPIDEHAHHGHHDHTTDAVDSLSHGETDGCCDGAICQCGCVLPPALSLALSEPHPPARLAQRFQRLRSVIATHHQTPLLRPPAA